MAKKKVNPVVYVPISSNIPSITENIPDIPQYDDTGISYKKYAKIPTGNKEYKLKRQDTRFYFIGVVEGLKDNYFNRPNYTTHSFYTRTIHIAYNLTAVSVFSFYDGPTANNARFRTYLPIGSGHIVINFDDCPRPFDQEQVFINVLTPAGADYFLVANEFITIGLYGWDEEK